MVNGSPISTGRFNTASTNSTQTFSVVAADLEAATQFILSLEPANGDDPAPSNIKILMGSFVTDTPTDNTGGVDNGNNDRGVWFIQNLQLRC